MAAKDVVFLLLLHSPPATAAPLEQWRTLFSISQSLMRRVSTFGAARGDLAGAARTGPLPIGSTAGGASGPLSSPWAGTTSGTTHGGTSPLEVFGVMTDINQRLAAVNELVRVGSDAGRARFVAGDYRMLFSAVASLLKILLLALSRSVSGWVFLWGVCALRIKCLMVCVDGCRDR